MFTVHLVLFAFLFKSSDLKIILEDTLVYQLNETDNPDNNTGIVTVSGDLNLTTELTTIEVITEQSSENKDKIKPRRFSISERSVTDKTYDDYSDFNEDEFPDEKLRLLLSPKEYLTLNRTQLRTIKINPEASHLNHGQRTEAFLSHVVTLDQIYHWNESKDEIAKFEAADINVMESNNVNEDRNFSSIAKRAKVISVNASEWIPRTKKNETINVIEENNTGESIFGTQKRIEAASENWNISEVGINPYVSNVNRIEGDNLKFNQKNDENESLMGSDQFLNSKPAQWSMLQDENEPLIKNGTSSVIDGRHSTALNLNHLGVQKSKNHDSTSKSQTIAKIFNETLVEKSKNATEIDLISENDSNDNLPNKIMNPTSRWDANSSDSQVLRTMELSEEKVISQEASVLQNSTRSEHSDDDFYEELDDDFEFDDGDNGDDEDVEEYESANPYGTVVIVLPEDGDKTDLKSSPMKSEMVNYDKITNSLLYLLTNLTVTATINERNTKNILRQLGHQKEQFRLLKNQYDAISNYLVKMTDSKDK